MTCKSYAELPPLPAAAYRAAHTCLATHRRATCRQGLHTRAASHNYFWWCKNNKSEDSQHNNDKGYKQVCLYLSSPTPIPAVLHVSREPRNLGLYHQAYGTYLHIEPPEHRYVYINWELDVIDIGTQLLSSVSPFKHKVQPLRMGRRKPASWAEVYDWPDLVNYKSVKELSILCIDGLYEWRHGTKTHTFPCSPQQVYYIDPDTGQSASAATVEAYFARVDAEHEQQVQHTEHSSLISHVDGEDHSHHLRQDEPPVLRDRIALAA